MDGLPLQSGAQLAVDTTLVCALRRDGTPVGPAAQQDGVVLQSARRREEMRMFLSLLARAKVRCENPLLHKRIQQAWRLRCALLSCTTASAVASSMLELLGARGADGDTSARCGAGFPLRRVGGVSLAG